MRRLEKKQAVKLRLQGKSYNEIREILNIPSKGTLSYWFKNLKLTKAAKRRLKQKIAFAREHGLLKFNRDRTKAIQLENRIAKEFAKKTIGLLTKRELLLVGTALYWGEGYKRAKYPSFSLSNSDPALISVFMRIIREVFLIPDEKIRAHIQIHPNLRVRETIKFWSKVTYLPPDNFRVIKLVSQASKNKRPKNFLPYGTLDVRVNSRQLYFKMMGFIEGLAKTAKKT